MDENNAQNNIGGEKSIKTIHTYTSDMADAIRENEASVIKIAMAEKEKRDREAMYRDASGTKSSKIFLLLGGIILIGLSIFGSYLLFRKSSEAPVAEKTVKDIETLISFDSKVFIDATDDKIQTDLLNSIKEEVEKPTQPTGIKAIILIEDFGSGKELLPVENLISVLGDRAPAPLMRTLQPDYMLGTYTDAKNIPHLFLILGLKDYNQAYASMLDWEKTLLEDMFIIFQKDLGVEGATLFEKPWKDIIINNKDARIIYDKTGTDLLYYIFPNKNNLVITDNQEAIKEITNRLLAKVTKPL